MTDPWICPWKEVSQMKEKKCFRTWWTGGIQDRLRQSYAHYMTHFQGGRSGERGRGAAQSLIGRAGLLMISLIKRKDLSLVLSMKHASKKLKDVPWSNKTPRSHRLVLETRFMPYGKATAVGNMFHRCFGPGVITSVYLSLTGERFCSLRPLGLWDRPGVSGADQWSMIILKMLFIFWK